MDKIWQNVNLNNYVRFKLTDKGREYINALNQNNPIYSRCPLKFKVDSDGWIEEQLWHFMYLFGSEMYMGFEQIVETEIQILVRN